MLSLQQFWGRLSSVTGSDIKVPEVPCDPKIPDSLELEDGSEQTLAPQPLTFIVDKHLLPEFPQQTL